MRRFGISLLAILLLATQVAADSLGVGGGIPVSAVVISGTPAGGNCAKWINSTTVGDSGGACGAGSGTGITGTPVANQLTDWASATNVQGITTGTGVVTALGVNTNTNGGFLTMTGAPGTGILSALTVNTNAAGGEALVNGTPTAPDCLQWSATGVQDFGGPCSPSGQISGRLTLTTGTPVLTASVAGATSVYFTPYKGNTLPLWNSTLSKFVWTTFAETSQLTTDTTLSPAAVTTNSNYDVFCWNPAAVHCTHGPAWSSATARGTGVGTTQLSLVQGIWVNTNAITNGPAALTGVYVGSFRSNGSSTVDFTFAGAASGGTAGVIGLWNYYNRVPISMKVVDNGVLYTYATITIREWRAGTGAQISFLSGMAEDSPFASFSDTVYSAAVLNSYALTGICLDCTNAFDVQSLTFAPTAVTYQVQQTGNTIYPAQLGWHVLTALEASDGTNAATFDAKSINQMTLQTTF